MKVTVGVAGGIAAYKAAELVRALQQQALDVHVVMTASAGRFIQPLTFAALTGHKVISSLWADANAPVEDGTDGEPVGESSIDSSIEHIAAAQTDALVVAPATANTIARFAHGIADDFLSTLYLATTAPVIVAPAMNVKMWEHAAVQANLVVLETRGVRIVAPDAGHLACGMVGAGRLAETQTIVQAVLEQLSHRHDLASETVLVTAGGTREAIDPVRFLGNRSSGKMGYALAEAAAKRGARVILITGKTSLRPPLNCEVIQVVTSDEMRFAVMERLAEATIVIKAAAVSDYRPIVTAGQKIKREGPITIHLEPTHDILREVAERKRAGTLVIGFAAETENPFEHARQKLARKGADAIVLNDVSRTDIGFDSDKNAVTFLTHKTAVDLPEMSKRELADRILGEILSLRRPVSFVSENSPTRSLLQE